MKDTYKDLLKQYVSIDTSGKLQYIISDSTLAMNKLGHEMVRYSHKHSRMGTRIYVDVDATGIPVRVLFAI